MENIQDDLVKLFSESQRVLAENRYSFADSRAFVSYLSELRMLLDLLLKAPSIAKRDETLILDLHHLREQCLELEGMAKEARNDWERYPAPRSAG